MLNWLKEMLNGQFYEKEGLVPCVLDHSKTCSLTSQQTQVNLQSDVESAGSLKTFNIKESCACSHSPNGFHEVADEKLCKIIPKVMYHLEVESTKAEDRITIIEHNNSLIIGIADGHGGSSAAEFITTNTSLLQIANGRSQSEVHDIFHKIDCDFLDLNPVTSSSGSTASVVTFKAIRQQICCDDSDNADFDFDEKSNYGLQVCVAHIGDCSVAKLIAQQTPGKSGLNYNLEVVTEEHNTRNESEIFRIGNTCFEQCSDGFSRLNGNLLVTRAFGNWQDGQKPSGLSVIPQVSSFTLTQNDLTVTASSNADGEELPAGCVGVVVYSDGVLEAIRSNCGPYKEPLTILASAIGRRLGARVGRSDNRRQLDNAARDCLASLEADEFEDDASLVIVPFSDPNSGELLVPLIPLPQSNRFFKSRTLA
eukprot:Platyproteum_vivax@DN6811_c0_g1_i1.p1